MDSFWGLPSTAWTAIGTLLTAASLAATIVIAVVVQIASKRSAANARQVNDLMAELARRSRLDEVRRQLQDEQDPAYLQLLIEEGRELARRKSAERYRVEKAYFTNPAVPLPTNRSAFPEDIGPGMRRELLICVIRGLGRRYPSHDPSGVRWMPEFANLTRLAIDWEAPVHEIAGFIAARAADGWTIRDTAIRLILFPGVGYACPPNLEAAEDFLYSLRHAPVTRANMVNIVAGVSQAVLDFRRDVAPHGHLGNG